MCGEMASDPRYTRLLLAMGLEIFSMHPNAVLEIKQIINESSLGALPENALQILQMSDPFEAEKILDQINQAELDQ
jgi:phosphotransferase system enzyme I (PtsI)